VAREFAYDWAVRFNDHVRDSLVSHQFDKLVDYAAFGEAAGLSAPDARAFLPLALRRGPPLPTTKRAVAADGGL